MMRLAAALALSLAIPAVVEAQPAQPGTIPQAAQGLWANGQCTDPGALLFLTGRYWALLPQQGPQELWRVARTAEGGGFTLAVADDADQTRLIMRAQGTQLETRTPGPKQPDDVIPGDAPATQWARCPAIAGGLAALHGEGLSFLGALDGFEAACSGDAAGCMTAVFAWADVTRDGVLTPAELARLVRGATHMAMLATGAELDQLATALGAGALGGIVAAQLLIHSYDYDGSGSLSQAEMLQDRSPMPGIAGPAAPPAAAVAGPPLGGAALAGQVGALRTLLDQLGPMLGLPQR
ncbi:hypothetical protein [Elioraea sp.]|uniref:hypothetical protein n=1 Tax=Elioraea sp. TaxID=2185103 RepID=UPI0025BF2CC9|nr:hypothetical protein [Elioraea sp.]